MGVDAGLDPLSKISAASCRASVFWARSSLCTDKRRRRYLVHGVAQQGGRRREVDSLLLLADLQRRLPRVVQTALQRRQASLTARGINTRQGHRFHLLNLDSVKQVVGLKLFNSEINLARPARHKICAETRSTCPFLCRFNPQTTDCCTFYRLRQICSTLRTNCVWRNSVARLARA